MGGAQALVPMAAGGRLQGILDWERQVSAEPFGMVPVNAGFLPTPAEGRAGD